MLKKEKTHLQIVSFIVAVPLISGFDVKQHRLGFLNINLFKNIFFASFQSTTTERPLWYDNIKWLYFDFSQTFRILFRAIPTKWRNHFAELLNSTFSQ